MGTDLELLKIKEYSERHSQQKVSVDLAERRSGPPSADGMQDKSVEGSLNRRLV